MKFAWSGACRLQARYDYRLWMIIGSSCSVHFPINLWKTSNWSRGYLISTFNKEKYWTRWVLTENFHCTISACVNISSLEYRNVTQLCVAGKWFYITFNNVTIFITGLKDDKTLKAFFPEGYSEPSLTRGFVQKHLICLSGCWIRLCILKCRAITLKKVQVASAAFLKLS